MNVGSRKTKLLASLRTFIKNRIKESWSDFVLRRKKLVGCFSDLFRSKTRKKSWKVAFFFLWSDLLQKLNDKQNLRKAISVFHLSSKNNWKDYLFVVVAAAFACCCYCCWCRWCCCCCTFWAQLLLWLVAIAFVASVEAFVDATTTYLNLLLLLLL